MNLIINPLFWGLAVTVYLLLLVRLPGKLIFRFGLFNLITLIILLGWQVSLVALGFVVAIWTVITLVKNKSNSPSRSLVCVGFFTAILFLFLLHEHCILR